MRRHITFLLTMGLIAPAIAIAGVASGGRWTPSALAGAGAVVAWAAAMSWLDLRADGRMPAVPRVRMMGVAATVAVAAAILAVGSLVALGLEPA